jgi:hypothetical protein
MRSTLRFLIEKYLELKSDALSSLGASVES